MKALFAIALLLGIGAAPPAFAHAFLKHADPGAGAHLAKAPAAVTLDFSEALEPAFSGAQVSDAAGHEVSSAAKVSGSTITVTLGPLKPGTYKVRWHAVSVDTHRTQGAYSFTVGP